MSLIGLFLEAMPEVSMELPEGALAGLLAMAIGFLVMFMIFGIAIYVYMSLVYMNIAKKAQYSSPGIAWLPIVGPALISSKIAEMHWWPILLLIGFIIPVLGMFFSLAFAVFMIIWTWKMFEKFDKPGWWAIICIIPLLNIVYFVFLGIVAWGDAQYKGNTPLENQI